MAFEGTKLRKRGTYVDNMLGRWWWGNAVLRWTCAERAYAITPIIPEFVKIRKTVNISTLIPFYNSGKYTPHSPDSPFVLTQLSRQWIHTTMTRAIAARFYMPIRYLYSFLKTMAASIPANSSFLNLRSSTPRESFVVNLGQLTPLILSMMISALHDFSQGVTTQNVSPSSWIWLLPQKSQWLSCSESEGSSSLPIQAQPPPTTTTTTSASFYTQMLDNHLLTISFDGAFSQNTYWTPFFL